MEQDHSFLYQGAMARSRLYHFISSIYLAPPGKQFLELIQHSNFLEELSLLLGNRGVAELKESAMAAHPEMNPASLKQEYMDLFAVPTGRYVCPFEDVYRWINSEGTFERGPLLGERAIAVIRRYREAGAEMDRACGELPTHIGLELSFMSFLCEREAAEVCKEGENTRLSRHKREAMNSSRYRELQKKFLQEHLMGWFPQLSRVIQANTKSPFYRSMALMTEAFLSWDTAGLEEFQ
jgi:TorA maturation chaperone TorD